MKVAREQKETVEAITRLGGGVGYDYDLAHPIYTPTAQPSRPWLRNVFGDDYFKNVDEADLNNAKVTDENWVPH